MKPTLITIVVFFVLIVSISGQRNLSKEEIIKYWVTQKKSGDSTLGVKVDIFPKVQSIIDSLRNKGIDSLVVYSIALPGYTYSSSCMTQYPTYTFLLWKRNNYTVIKKFEGNCMLDLGYGNSTALFDFYRQHASIIDQEIIMPPIYNAQISDSNMLTYSGSWSTHEPFYSLYYFIADKKRLVQFSKSDTEDKESLFFDDNIKSKLYAWWLIVDKERKLWASNAHNKVLPKSGLR